MRLPDIKHERNTAVLGNIHHRKLSKSSNSGCIGLGNFELWHHDELILIVRWLCEVHFEVREVLAFGVQGSNNSIGGEPPPLRIGDLYLSTFQGVSHASPDLRIEKRFWRNSNLNVVNRKISLEMEGPWVNPTNLEVNVVYTRKAREDFYLSSY